MLQSFWHGTPIPRLLLRACRAFPALMLMWLPSGPTAMPSSVSCCIRHHLLFCLLLRGCECRLAQAQVLPMPGPASGLPPSCEHNAAQTNDHKALTRQMERLLHQLHALSNQPGGGTPAAAAAAAGELARPPVPAAAAPPQGSAAAAQHPAAALPPFAVVDELSQGSPAAAAGLQLWDQMLSFAGVTKQTPDTLQAVAAALQANQGRPVETVVLRQGAPAVLQLTPQPWGGRGLLGCHLRPL